MGEFSTTWDDESIEHAIMNDGVNFNVKYIGCIEVLTSMKLLDFQSRSLVAKECINRVLDFANIRSPKKRRVDKRISNVIHTQPCMEHLSTNVVLNISSKCLQLTSVDTNEIIAKHEMPRISFASGGDSDSMNYVAYVAKDIMEWRACYVIDCGIDKAQTVISTMGQAFELRYKNFCSDDAEQRERMSTLKRKQQLADCMNPKCDQDYYNDLPNKMPPEFEDAFDMRRERLPSNLIDLNDHDYVNDDANKHGSSASGDAFSFINNNSNNNTISRIHQQPFSSADVFDIPMGLSVKNNFPLSAEVQRSQLIIENWYHGPISRALAENLIKNDGDFLVRQSQGTAGQFVLSGLNGTPKHLLLIDPEGVVRTKDRVFDSITHLINYHWTNHLPIISNSFLFLKAPVIRTTDLRK